LLLRFREGGRASITWRSCLLGALLVGSFPRQAWSADSASGHREEELVFRADLTMVQVDAVVTDKKGRYITDLGCGDFEIFEDNHKQPISQCAFVPAPGSPAPRPSLDELRGPPGPNSSQGGRIERDAVRRTIVLVVDDLGLDLQSVLSVRVALLSFIEDQMEPGDLVSVLRTGGGTGSLQRFASDKRILRAAIDRVRFNVAASVDAFDPVGSIPRPVSSSSMIPKPPGRDDSDEFRTEMFAEGTVGALRFALSGLRDLPGRKSVVFFSKGYALRNSKGLTTFGMAVPSLVDLANRASVVIYTVDTRGVSTGQLTASDNVADVAGADGQTIAGFQGGLMNALRSRRSHSGLDGLAALSDPTGGLLLRGQNDLSRQVKRMLEDQKGYYLIGYVPSASAFEAEKGLPAFHKIRVKVRRQGLTARSRSGFYGIPDDRANCSPASGRDSRECGSVTFLHREVE
jgi:VWFA-related protein